MIRLGEAMLALPSYIVESNAGGCKRAAYDGSPRADRFGR
jgi:hypothetical protein